MLGKYVPSNATFISSGWCHALLIFLVLGVGELAEDGAGLMNGSEL